MKRMLINATNQEELRIAIVEGQQLCDIDIEYRGYEHKKANIYKGKIIHIEPSLQAAFVDYGMKKHGFLPLREVSKEYFSENYSSLLQQKRLNIKEILCEGQEIIVQINKEERGNKGAALTTLISLAGSFLVLMPNNSKAMGISRRIEGKKRFEIKKIISSLRIPNGMSVIIRTAGIGKSLETLQLDLNLQLNQWQNIKNKANTTIAPCLLYQDSNVMLRAFRDYLYQDILEILIDNPQMFELAKKQILELGRGDFIKKMKLYSGPKPLFSYYQIESQIESAFQREVNLPSGGSIIIETTEALTAIDINSSRSTRCNNLEETAFYTNLEAADEIARQLRLRDLGGLIVIDFIDMITNVHQRTVQSRLREAISQDRARIQIGKISRLGLLEMSRQRLSPSLRESNHHICPRCQGTGLVRDNESLSLAILRLIEEQAIQYNTKEVHAIVPVDIASYLLNEKRGIISTIEQQSLPQIVRVVIVPNAEMKRPDYLVYRIKLGEERATIRSVLFPKINRSRIISSQLITSKYIKNIKQKAQMNYFHQFYLLIKNQSKKKLLNLINKIVLLKCLRKLFKKLFLVVIIPFEIT